MIIFTGVAGSGKSMQGKLLADKLALPWLSTGEFLRMLISGERRYEMTKGKLLQDEDIISLVQKIFTIVDPKEECIIDGFPRTIGQADWLLTQAQYDQLKITAVIHLVVDEAAVMSRLLHRGRQDDTEAAIRERFEEYEASIKPILSMLKEASYPVHAIDGSQKPEIVHQAIVEALNKKS